MKLIFLLIINLTSVWAQTMRLYEFEQPENLVPAYIFLKSDKFVLIAEKNTGKLHLFKSDRYLHSYKMTSGLKKGNKLIEGDKKTPLGVYKLENYLKSETLINLYGDYSKIFGAGALTLNYPNPIDIAKNKTGSNIWLHGTDTPDRINFLNTSKGCLVVRNEDFIDILEVFKENDLYVVIVNDMEWISKENQAIYLSEFEGLRTIDQGYDIKKQQYFEYQNL